MVDLPAPEGPTTATVWPAGTSKLSPLRIWPAAARNANDDILETDHAAPHFERLGARLILDLRLAGEDCKHRFDVDHRLLDLAIDHAHEIQRLIELKSSWC